MENTDHLEAMDPEESASNPDALPDSAFSEMPDWMIDPSLIQLVYGPPPDFQPSIAHPENNPFASQIDASESATSPAVSVRGEGWICVCCGTVATGKFCPECGSSRPKE